VAVIAWAAGARALAGPAAIAAPAFLALAFRGHPQLSGFSFSLSVLTAVVASLFYPTTFRALGGYELKNLIVPLIQIIMFGMGTTLSLADFARVLKFPWAVFVGMVLQFGVMPFSGWAIAHLFGFEPQIAAGVILVGAAPGGVASNVITYLAGGNVALSVTMTACSTLLSPLLTPAMMKLLAGAYVPVGFVEMMLSILNMIVLPVAAGLVANKLLHGRAAWLDRSLPLLSMAAICVIIAIITSLSRDKLLEVGPALIAAVALHNGVGYLLGYGGARAARLGETDARTVAIEVGLQNAGMASGLAISVLRSSDAGLAPAIFGPWMNVSGSILASFWRRRRPRD
jgi:bile acid:Na+ symporter, BASS family